MGTQCQHLTTTQRNYLMKLFQIFEDLFDGTLGTYRTDPVDFKMKEDPKPVCLWPYPVPKLLEKFFKNEVERLVLIGVLKIANDPEWGAPSFSQPKHKSNQVTFYKWI